jgi:hypothetical protein
MLARLRRANIAANCGFGAPAGRAKPAIGFKMIIAVIKAKNGKSKTDSNEPPLTVRLTLMCRTGTFRPYVQIKSSRRKLGEETMKMK